MSLDNMDDTKYSGLKYKLIKQRPKRLFTINHTKTVQERKQHENTQPI